MQKETIQSLQTQMKAFYQLLTLQEEVGGFQATAHNGHYAAPAVKQIMEHLDRIIRDEAKPQLSWVKATYQSLYPPKSGLREFYIWSNDFSTRKKCNDAFQETRQEIETILDLA